DSPTLRLEQSGASGFTPQTWDVAGNETNFFVRDATGGSDLPFRIRAGAPSDALFIDSDGDIGLGTSSPSVQLQVGTTTTPGDAYITGALTIDGEVEVVNKSIDVDKDVKVGRDLILRRNLEMTDNYDEVTDIPFFILDRNNSSNAADDVMLLRVDGAGNLAINGTLTENGVPLDTEGTRNQIRDLEAENEELRARIERLERLVEELATRDQ
ncbi:MAG: bZIP transcription factor, partial [Bacteroidota bacterium]